MTAWKLLSLSILGSTCALLLGGCPNPASRTGNQGGSNPIQATSKLLSNNLAGMNPDDVQVLADVAIELGSIDLPPVTDEQASAAISFLQANGIETIQDLEDLIRRARADIDSIVIPDDVMAVLETIAGNLDAYKDLDDAASDQPEDEGAGGNIDI